MVNEIFILFKSKANQVQLQVKFEKETLWLILNQMDEFFNHGKSFILRHLKRIVQSVKLIKDSVVAKNAADPYKGRKEFKPIFCSKLYGIST